MDPNRDRSFPTIVKNSRNFVYSSIPRADPGPAKTNPGSKQRLAKECKVLCPHKAELGPGAGAQPLMSDTVFIS